jgi:2,3-bisphosphoglycerate-independent phosphoglycerate mutase
VVSEKVKHFKATIGTIHCTDTALDKTQNWNWTSLSHNALLNPNKGNFSNRADAEKFLDSLSGPSPWFDPILLDENSVFRPGDLVVLFNYREDRSVQLAKALIRGLKEGERLPEKLRVLPMILYDQSLMDVQTILPAINYSNSLGSWIASRGHKQIRIAESYKRPHVTTFFSGGILQPIYQNEDRPVIDSVPDAVVQFYPKMNASLVTETAVNAIKSREYKLVVVNFANVDATGHSGNDTAVRLAVEYVDEKIREIMNECEKNGYALFVTADHGNGEENKLLGGAPQVEHTLNNVGFLTNVRGYRVRQPPFGKAPFLGNVAATILHVLDIVPPPEMEDSLYERESEGFAQTDSKVFALLLGFFMGAFSFFVLMMMAKRAGLVRCLFVRFWSPPGIRHPFSEL